MNWRGSKSRTNEKNSRNYLKADLYILRFALVLSQSHSVFGGLWYPYRLYLPCADLKMSSILLSSVSWFTRSQNMPALIDPSIFVVVMFSTFLPQSSSISSELKINIKFPIKLEGIGCKNLYATHVSEVWSKIPFYFSIAVSLSPQRRCVVHSKTYFRVRIFFVPWFLFKSGRCCRCNFEIVH